MLAEPQPVTIDPAAFYDDDLLAHVLGVGLGVLTRARRSGGLRYATAGSRRLYQGAWVIEWLSRTGMEASHA